MKTITVDASKFDTENIWPSDWPEILAQPMEMFFQKSAFITEARAKENAPRDTGHLWASIKTTGVSPMGAYVGTDVVYAPPVEYGSKAHWPPRGALQPWARRHGFPAGPRGDFLVRRAIARRGIKPKPFLRKAIMDSMQDYGTALEQAIEGIVRNIERYWETHNFNAT